MTKYKLCYFCSKKAVSTGQIDFNPEDGDILYSREINICEKHADYGDFFVMTWSEERQRWEENSFPNWISNTPKRPTKEEATFVKGENIEK
jgi:hypothetical protein